VDAALGSKCPPDNRDPLTEFRSTLSEIGFNEAGLKQLLGILDVPLLRPHDMASYLKRCQKDESGRPLAVCLWLLTLNVRRVELESLFGTDLVAELLQRDFLVQASEARLRSRVDLYPCLGVWVFTDQVLASEFHPQHVYQLGTDSYVLARVTPRVAGHSALDLCTGSGIHAILAARDHQQVTAVDLNPRALEFGRFNARLNGLEDRCQFLEGDLYAPVADQTFDLITANPPFVPTPDKGMQLHRGVGETGEELPQRIVEGLPRHLRQGGTLSMVLDYPMLESSSYLERLNLWLSQGEQTTSVAGWGVAVTHFATESCEQYIKNHLDSGDASRFFKEYSRYLRSYERQGIQSIGFANVFIRRLPADHPGFSVLRPMAIPHEDVSANIEDWLRALSQIHDPHWTEVCLSSRPRISPRIRAIWNPQDRQRGAFEFQDALWCPLLYSDRPTLELATRLDGHRTLHELCLAWANESGQDFTLVLQQFRISLACLMENLVCVM